jgi:hypothetical protein
MSHYGYGEQTANPTVHELANRNKKKQEIDNGTGGWRSGTNLGYNEDDVFNMIRSTKKANTQTSNNVKSASLTTATTEGKYTKAYYECQAGHLPQGLEIIVATDDEKVANEHNDKVIADYY